MLKYYIYSLLLLSVVIQACKNKNPENVMPSDAGVSVPKSEIAIKRYENALFGLNKNQLRTGMAKLYPEYAFFLGNDWRDTINMLRIHNFLNDENIKELYALTSAKYPDLKFLENDLSDAFTRFQEWYPEKPTPKVFSYVSGLDIENPVYFADSAMAIGLDLFLGSDVSAYAKAGIPKYKTKGFIKERIVPMCMLAVSDYVIRADEKHNTLLDQMVLAGKALYFLDVTLPDVDDEYKIGYTKEQLLWSRNNESQIWAFIIENQLLFSSDNQGITKMMTDAPFTSGFASDSPGRLGAYIGWQIVRAYMKETRGITLKQLMDNTDAQQILKQSHFKPAKN